MAINLEFVSVQNNRQAAKLVRSHAARVSHRSCVADRPFPFPKPRKRRRRRKDVWSFEVHLPALPSSDQGSTPKDQPESTDSTEECTWTPAPSLVAVPIIPALETTNPPPYLPLILDNCEPHNYFSPRLVRFEAISKTTGICIALT